MTFPKWTKPGAYGAVAGAVFVSVLGFTWGGWTTAGGAQDMAQTFATQEVTLAMLPVCLNATAADPGRVILWTQSRNDGDRLGDIPQCRPTQP